MINCILFAAFLGTFWLLRNWGLGFYVGRDQLFYYIHFSTIKDIYMSGVVSGMALTMALLFLSFTVNDIDKSLRIGLRFRIIRRKLKRRLL